MVHSSAKVANLFKVFQSFFFDPEFQRLLLECPAIFVPVEVRETGMRGALNGTREEEYTGADSEPAAAS